MIYLVSKELKPPSVDVKMMSIEDSLKLVRSWPVVQFDTETTGLDPHECSLTSMQFGYKDFKTGESTQIVVDCGSVDPKLYKDAIEKSYLIGHNLKFDLQFLFNHGIIPLELYDTMICEQCLYIGYGPKEMKMNLGAVLQRHTDFTLDKSFQKEIAAQGLTDEGIVYAANDVKYLQDIRRDQMEIAEGRKCLKAFAVENRCVPAMAYLEWCGIRMDEAKWTAKMANDKKDLDEKVRRLNEFVLKDERLKGFIDTQVVPSLFEDEGGESWKPKVTVLWSSPAQVVPVFKALGFNTEIFDKEKKRTKDSVQEKYLTVQTGICDEFLKLYFDYKGAYKNVTAYGQNFINQINPDTGRIHTVFRQIGTVTGRMASGDNRYNKDLAKRKKLFPYQVRYCNLQNLPAREEAGKIARACFIPEEGNAFISCDYSAEESRVSADVWDDPKLLHALRNGIDTHNLYAKMCFPEELKDVDVKDVKKVRPDLRQAAKAAEFATNYGSDGSSIALSIGMSVEKAKAMVKGIVDGLTGMKRYKEKAGKFLKDRGYLVINQTTGHRIYWPTWGRWKADENRFDLSFWNEYGALHKGTGDSVEREVKWYLNQKHEWLGKNVLNYPIQGGSAVVLKQAAGDFFRWIVRHNLFGVVKFCVFVHDEICCECPKDMSEKIGKVMEDIMEKAAAKYYHRLPIPAECSIGDHWIH